MGSHLHPRGILNRMDHAADSSTTGTAKGVVRAVDWSKTVREWAAQMAIRGDVRPSNCGLARESYTRLLSEGAVRSSSVFSAPN